MANTREVMGEQACLDALVADTLTELEDDGVTKVGRYALHNHEALERASLPNATVIDSYAFHSCTSLTEVDMPSVVLIEERAFENCTALTTARFGNVPTIDDYCFSACTILSSLSIGSPTRIGQRAFNGCRHITSRDIDLSEVTYMGQYAFDSSGLGEIVLPACKALSSRPGCDLTSVIDIGQHIGLSSSMFTGHSLLCHLVLRGATSVITLPSNVFSQTSMGAGIGWIYVPSDLVDAYKADTSWSAYASQIVSVNEYPKALQDETVSDSWSTIAASSTYATDYPIGSIKYVNIGGTRLAMQLVAVDTDDLASGGKARMTWISRGILNKQQFNLANTNSVGWDTSYARSYLRDVIYPQIEQDAREAIKEVSKTYLSATGESKSTSDTIWIPSSREMFGSGETSGCDYTSFFTDNTSRQKSAYPTGGNTVYWTRSRTTSGSYYQVNTSGQSTTTPTPTSTNIGLCIGFCI